MKNHPTHMDFKKVWLWYSRENVQNTLLEIAKNREVVSVYKDLSYGKRPDIIQFPADILQSVAEGVVAFHGSVERWSQPMSLTAGMNKPQLDKLRTGWDIIIDPDVDDFEIAKIATKTIVEALKDHGVKNFSIKFSGGRGFHIGIPFESMPEKVNFKKTSNLYPEVYHKVLEYIKNYIRDILREEILKLDTPINLAERIGKDVSKIMVNGELDPFKIVSFDLFGSRHLFRLPYSLHEKTFLVSVPIDYKKIEKFEKENAKPENVKVSEMFLVQKHKIKDATSLIIEALDWASKQKIKVEPIQEKVLITTTRKIKKIPEKHFPPCIKNILKGLSDGRKRSVFVLITFLRNVGWSKEEIEKKLEEWNMKNIPPLRPNFIRTQLRWHFRQERNLLPPNCDNPNFYVDFGVCEPDKTCKPKDEITIKNPINYPFKILSKKRKKKRKK